MNFFIYLSIALAIVWIYVLFFKKEPKENLDIDYSKKDEVKKPLSRETLRNINENRNDNYSRVKNTFFDLPCHNEVDIDEVDEEYEEDFIFTKVVGVTQKNDDDVERQEILKYCYEGEKLILEYDFDNKYSKYAIKVCRANNGEQIGYLEDSLAKKMKNREIEKFEVVLKEVTGGTIDKPNLGCNIKIIFSA